MAKLTKRAVETLEPPPAGQAFLWDGELKGFGVRVTKGGVKTFIIQYRNAEGKSRRINLGRFGIMTVENARDEAKIKFGALAAGRDPADAERSHHQVTVSNLCDWYLEEAEVGRILGRQNRPIKKSTLAMDKSRIETHIKPLLGKRLAHTLKIADIEGCNPISWPARRPNLEAKAEAASRPAAPALRPALSEHSRASLVMPLVSTSLRAIPAAARESSLARRSSGV